MPLIEVFADGQWSAPCRSCGKRIYWAKSVGRGKWMPFDDEPVAVKTRQLETTETVWFVDSTINKSHFSSCSEPEKWRRK